MSASRSRLSHQSALAAEGPLGQVELGIGVIARSQRPDLQIGGSVSHVAGQPSFSMISSGTE